MKCKLTWYQMCNFHHYLFKFAVRHSSLYGFNSDHIQGSLIHSKLVMTFNIRSRRSWDTGFWWLFILWMWIFQLILCKYTTYSNHALKFLDQSDDLIVLYNQSLLSLDDNKTSQIFRFWYAFVSSRCSHPNSIHFPRFHAMQKYFVLPKTSIEARFRLRKLVLS